MSYQKTDNSSTPRPSPNRTQCVRFEPNSHVPAKIPSLKSGHDSQRAKELEKYIKDAESGLVRILKAGFFLECLAEDLPHGQLGPWVETHCKGRTWRTIRRWKEIAASLGDTLGISLKKRLEYKLHEVLALPLKKVPEELKEVREKLDAEIQGKSYRQLFLELKQVDEDDPSKPKRGRLKGSAGLTKEQRDLAAQRAEQERLAELAEATTETADWLINNADAKNAGMLDNRALSRLQEACQTMSGFIGRVLAARKGGSQ